MSSITSFPASAKASDATNKVPRPMNCFMTYRLEKQREIVQQCPGANHRDISKIIAKWWKELPAAEKEPYRRRAEKAKAEHNKMYPNYKFCPKKKTTKPRAYKKRPGNEFTARDFENKQQLFALYHDGNTSAPSTELGTDFLLDEKPRKQGCDYTVTKKRSKKSSADNLDRVASQNKEYPTPSPSLTHPDESTFQQPTSYNIEMLYPVNNIYYSGSSVPSQSVYSPSMSPYTTGYNSATDEPVHGETVVNYNLYPSHPYVYAEPQAAPFSDPAQYHYAAPPNQYYTHTAPVDYHLKTGSAYDDHGFHSIAPRENSAFAYSGYSHAPSPALLTRPFYYQ